MGQLWETQWQEFLTNVEVPQILPEPSPWEDAHIFLASFEQVARAFQWPKEEWAAHLRPTLRGDAEQAYSSLELGDREDYGKMKAAILQADAMGEELGPRSENIQSLERGPSDAGPKLQFARELKMEEDADAGTWRLHENENHLQGRPKQAEQHGVAPERANSIALERCDPEEALGGQQETMVTWSQSRPNDTGVGIEKLCKPEERSPTLSVLAEENLPESSLNR
ncbi:hypothetical protein Chor_011647 [Crotalus horridus]